MDTRGAKFIIFDVRILISVVEGGWYATHVLGTESMRLCGGSVGGMQQFLKMMVMLLFNASDDASNQFLRLDLETSNFVNI